MRGKTNAPNVPAERVKKTKVRNYFLAVVLAANAAVVVAPYFLTPNLPSGHWIIGLVSAFFSSLCMVLLVTGLLLPTADSAAQRSSSTG